MVEVANPNVFTVCSLQFLYNESFIKKAENCLKKDTMASQINAYTARYYRTLCDLHVWRKEYPEAMHCLNEATKVYNQMKVKGNNSLQRVDQRLKLLEILKSEGSIDEMQKDATVYLYWRTFA